jgi:hypothetical protein
VNRFLDVYAGTGVRERLCDKGLQAKDITMILGASGGPKWFVLSALDEFFCGDYFHNNTETVDLLGASAGAWRFACYCRKDGVRAIQNFLKSYSTLCFTRGDIQEVSEKSILMLEEILAHGGEREILSHPVFKYNCVASAGRGGFAKEGFALKKSLGTAFIRNALGSNLMLKKLERWCFISGSEGVFEEVWNAVNFQQLKPETLRSAVLASGSIPGVMEGVSGELFGEPQKVFRDGGMVDYHMGAADFSRRSGVVLFPHFCARIIPGWFDKIWRGRKPLKQGFSNVVLICPSPDFIESLSLKKISDRKDFQTMDDSNRLSFWAELIEKAKLLVPEYQELCEVSNFRRVVKPLEELCQ